MPEQLLTLVLKVKKIGNGKSCRIFHNIDACRFALRTTRINTVYTPAGARVATESVVSKPEEVMKGSEESSWNGTWKTVEHGVGMVVVECGW